MKQIKTIKPALALCLFLSHIPLFAENEFSLGLGPEINIVTLEERKAALGGVISAENRFGPIFAAGVNLGAAYGWNNLIGIESRIFGRWYFVRPTAMEFFFQGDAGLLVTLRPSSPQESRGSPSVGMTLGARIFLPGSWYLEPYVRGGYPYLGGAGILMGYSPSKAKKNGEGRPEAALSGGEELLVRRELRTVPEIAALAIDPYVYFASDVASFTGLDRKTIENNYLLLVEIVEFLNQNPEYQLVIEGHANPVMNTKNEEETILNPLSMERADMVSKTLISYGIDRRRLIIAGSGGTKTLIPWQDRNHWNLNRRVEFTLFRQIRQTGR